MSTAATKASSRAPQCACCPRPRTIRGLSTSERPGTVIGPLQAACSRSAKAAWASVYMAEQERAGPAPGRAQDHQAGHGHQAGHRPLRGRAAGPGDDGPSEHRPGPRRRRDRHGPAVLRDGTGPRRADHRVLRREPASPPRERLELFIQVCQAIQHAHQKGIIHRDIKPSNVLVTLHDGKPVPKVIDFGIAKATGAAADRADAVHRASRSSSARRPT